jgi:hypothetical protein
MLDILRFIFSSFWVWAGSVVLLAVVATTVVVTFEGMIKALALIVTAGRN